MKVLLVNNDSDTWHELEAVTRAAGYEVTPIHHSAIGAIDPRGYDLAILSGGWWYDDEVELLREYAEELQLIKSTPIPILGICIGFQLMHVSVEQAVPMLDEPQYGWKEIDVNIAGQLLFGFPEKIKVFKNHTMGVVETDAQFDLLASSPGHAEITLHKERPLLGVQFHPEVGELDQAVAMLRQLVDTLMRVPLNTTAAAPEVSDKKWYEELKPLVSEVGETFVELMPSDEKIKRQHEEFVRSGYTALPNLFPEVPRASSLRDIRAKLSDLLEKISDDEPNADIRELYTERIREQVLNIDMIMAAKDGKAEEFQNANQIIYGTPDYEIFVAACNWIRQDAAKDHNGNVTSQLRDEILQIIPDVDGDASLLFPRDDVFQTVKELHFQHNGYVDQLFASSVIPDDTLITNDIGDPIVRQAIRNIGSSFEPVDSSNGMWSVLQSQHLVVRPSRYALKKEAFMAIVSHEIGSHLLESTNGETASLQLLELGLDRYECGNEGRAFLREHIMYQSIEDYIDQPLWTPLRASWEYRIAIHIVISLAVGLHGRNYDFAEIYQLLTILFRFWTAKRGQEIDEKVIHEGAWNMAVRALKGTDGHGGAYLKDIVYLEGNVRCWQSAAAHPELILLGDKGKFDVTNPVHIRALTNLGILPKLF